MNPRQIFRRFREFGGLRLVWQYGRMGVLLPVAKSLIVELLCKRSVKAAYSKLLLIVDRKLSRQYEQILHRVKARSKNTYATNDDRKGVPPIVWTCWLQGLDEAPTLVRQCIASQRASFHDYEHHVLTLDNYRHWVDLPEEVERKYRRGLMPAALFSDVLRLAVLLKYGGVWMDATVLCTGLGNERLQKQWQRAVNSTMTLFRYFNPQSKAVAGVSNWFIATKPGNVALEAVYEMLLAYWHDYDCTLDYYIMHLFLEMSQQYFPELWADMPRMSSRNALLLGKALGQIYNEAAWHDLTEHVALHKLNYRKVDAALKYRGSYCERLLAMNF